MKAIINRRIYRTETADLICTIDFGSEGDFHWEDTSLYRTRRGAFFLAGQGGPMSRWRHQEGRDYCSGSGLFLITVEVARTIMEQAGCSEEVFSESGFGLEEG